MLITAPNPASVGDVAAHYDDLDRFYREIWGEHVHHGLWESGRETPGEAVEALALRVARIAKVERGDRVCDVGCGYGATARLLTAERGADVTGITVSPAQHRVAESLGGGPRFVLGDWLANPFADASFDRVVSIECIGHVADKRRFFQEIHRVLRPGGTAAVAAWLTREFPPDWQRRHLLEPICEEGRLPGMGSEWSYRALAEEAGLRVTSFEDLSASVARTWTICIWRLLGKLLTEPEYWGFLFSGENAVFARTLVRIRLAYAFGAMRYGVYGLEKG